MNNHSVCLHVLSDSIRRYDILHGFSLSFSSQKLFILTHLVFFSQYNHPSEAGIHLLFLSAGLILASWLLSLG